MPGKGLTQFRMRSWYFIHQLLTGVLRLRLAPLITPALRSWEKHKVCHCSWSRRLLRARPGWGAPRRPRVPGACRALGAKAACAQCLPGLGAGSAASVSGTRSLPPLPRPKPSQPSALAGSAHTADACTCRPSQLPRFLPRLPLFPEHSRCFPGTTSTKRSHQAPPRAPSRYAGAAAGTERSAGSQGALGCGMGQG